MTHTTSALYEYKTVTAGERLYQFLRRWLHGQATPLSPVSFLSVLDREDEWKEYIEQLLAVFLTGHLVSAGSALRDRYDATAVFSTELKSYIHAIIQVAKNEANAIERLTTTATDERRRGISRGLSNKLRAWSREEHPQCYLCGESLDFADPDCARAYTADHIWPQSYGGDSIEDNLLPACKECNSKHKANFATWAMTGVQSLILGFEPSDEILKRVPGSMRYAIHHRQVQQVAINRHITLREAYLQVGHSQPLRPLRRLEVTHFFNLDNYSSRLI